MRTIGSALTGFANGIQDYNTNLEDRQFELARRAALLKSADQSSQLQGIQLTEAQNQLQDSQLAAMAYANAVGQPTPMQQAPSVPAAPQGVPSPQAVATAMPQGAPTQANPAAGLQPSTAPASQGRNATDWTSILRAGLDDPDPAVRAEMQSRLSQMTPGVPANFASGVAAQQPDTGGGSDGTAPDQAPQGTSSAPPATPLPGAPGATNYYAQQADLYTKAAQAALAQATTDPATQASAARVASGFQAKAQAAKEQLLKSQTEELDLRKKQMSDIGTTFATLNPETTTQQQYSTMFRMQAQNPAFQQLSQVAGLTGDINQDRNNLGLLQHLGETANQVDAHTLQAQEIKLKNDALQLKQQQQAQLTGSLKQAASLPKYDENGMALSGAALLAQLDPGLAATVKGIISGQVPMENISMRNDQRSAMTSLVLRVDPSYNQPDYTTAKNAEKAFTTGTQGNAVTSLNIALNHLDTLQNYYNALQNGNAQAINAATNTVKAWYGSAPPAAFDAIKPIVSDEIVKAIIGSGAGALADREQIANAVSTKLSPQQFASAIGGYKQLFQGQLQGKAEQYQAATKRNDFYTRFVGNNFNADGTPKSGGQMDTSGVTTSGAKTLSGGTDIGSGFTLH